MASKREQLVKVEAVEVLPPDVQPVGPPAEEAKLQALVHRHVAEALVQEGMLFEPWFRSRRVAEEIRRLQVVPERRVSAACYERWGCMICRTKSRPHASHSMCGRCNALHSGRRKEIKRELLGEKEHPAPRACEDCGRRFPPMTDAQWEQAREKHEISRQHTRKLLYPEGAVARSCAICRKDFRPMTKLQWNDVRQGHERGYRHRLALRKRKAK